MLERVPLLDRNLADYEGVVAPGTVERIRELAEPLQGARVLHVNATAYGGGVAELLSTHVPLSCDVGLERRVAGHPRQRRVLRGHQDGAQRAAGCRRRVEQQHGARLPRARGRQRDRARGRVGLHRHPRSAARGHPGVHPGPRRRPAQYEVDLALPHRPHRRERDSVGLLPAVHRAVRRIRVDDAAVRACVADDGQDRARTALHRPTVGEEPRPRVERSSRRCAAAMACGPTTRSWCR